MRWSLGRGTMGGEVEGGDTGEGGEGERLTGRSSVWRTVEHRDVRSPTRSD